MDHKNKIIYDNTCFISMIMLFISRTKHKKNFDKM